MTTTSILPILHYRQHKILLANRLALALDCCRECEVPALQETFIFCVNRLLKCGMSREDVLRNVHFPRSYQG